MRTSYFTQRLLEKPKISDIKNSDKIYKLLNLTEEETEKANIRVIDECKDDNLILLHYVKEDGELSDSAKRVRGVIIENRDNPRILVRSFPYTDEKTLNDYSEEFINGILKNNEYQFTNINEGTILRVFQGPTTGKYYISTHRKIDGYKSKWSGTKSFGQYFDSILGSSTYDPCFDKDKAYIFLLSTPENRLVCNLDKPILTLISTYSINQGVFQNAVCGELKHDSIQYQEYHTPYDSIKSLKEYIDNLDVKNYGGILVIKNDYSECYKIYSEKYFQLRNVRGGEPNLKIRYLHFIDDTHMKEQLYKLFSDYSDVFKKADDDIIQLAKFLTPMYINRYFKNRRLVYPKYIHFVLQNTLSNHNKKLSVYDNILATLYKTPGIQLNNMIKYMNELNK